MQDLTPRRIVVGVTGASGGLYEVRFLKAALEQTVLPIPSR